MNSNSRETNESKLPVPGTVYMIPTGTHADLDIQDDKDQALQDAFARAGRAWRNKFRRRHS